MCPSCVQLLACAHPHSTFVQWPCSNTAALCCAPLTPASLLLCAPLPCTGVPLLPGEPATWDGRGRAALRSCAAAALRAHASTYCVHYTCVASFVRGSVPFQPALWMRAGWLQGRSWIAAGFVKWIEAAGGRAVPIRWECVVVEEGTRCRLNCRYYRSGAEQRWLFSSFEDTVSRALHVSTEATAFPPHAQVLQLRGRAAPPVQVHQQLHLASPPACLSSL